jgi:uncharacterized GH25 family protein
MNKHLVLAFVTLSLPLGTAPAHEIKVLASQMALDRPAGKTTVYLSWGHRLPVDDLIDGKSIERYELLAPSGKSQSLKTDDLSLQANSLELHEAGVNQAVVSRRVTVYTHVIDAEGNKLLKRGPKSAVKEGKVEYALRSVQCAKAMIVAGTDSVSLVKPIGQAIEIVPLESAASWRAGQTLRFQVLLNGKPLPTATMVASYVGFRPDNAWCYSTSTGREGIAKVRVSQPGTWVLKVNTRENAVGEALTHYDYTSYTATLSLEIRP